MRRTTPLQAGVAATLLPFLLVLFFTWARTGAAAGVVALFGRAELFPPTALLCAQSLAAAYGRHPARRDDRWAARVGICWITFGFCCVGYVVPYAGGTSGVSARLAWTSLVFFTGSVRLGLTMTTVEPTGGGSTCNS
jgi:hypothetical protein